ncbi:ankyrin repeat domain-containing protein [Chitinolyticbacter meiyuanensis]|uniref:ankyrin repeat domain-containing protein n=1 Tax=Chitinolyticbacter meiyuanensis TaxID=682798 RepID=UPI0011E5A4CE|nr:ankyrin repeat domain-containing protein [Chitinolyticbacter meiyuanensis]
MRLAPTMWLAGLLLVQQAVACTAVADPWLTLAVAIREGRGEALSCLLNQTGINAHDPSDIWESAPLHQAARYDRPALIEQLLAAGADIDLENAVGETALLVAIKRGASDSAATLLLAGARFTTVDEEGRTPLFWAVAGDDVAIASLLLKLGADPDQIYTSGEQPARIRDYAAKRAVPKMMQLFESNRR